MTGLRRGEIWWGEIEGYGRRPFLIVTRDAAIPVLTGLVCAPLTRRVRSIPSELPLETDDGVPEPCAASFDNLRVIPKSHLTERIAQLSPSKMYEMCRALQVAVDC